MIYAFGALVVLCLVLIRMVFTLQGEVERANTLIAVYRLRNKKSHAEVEYHRTVARDRAREIQRLKRQIRNGLSVDEKRVDL